MLYARILLVLLVSKASISAKRKNVILVVADDLGFNDVPWRNRKVNASNLDDLYSKGVRLKNYYVQPTCSPSRAAFLTGFYPHRIGISEIMPSDTTSGCLDTKLTLLPQILKREGYSTHLIGKWHLGFCDWKCTPTHRGFDTFYGLYDGYTDHFTHRHEVQWSEAKPKPEGLDFRDGEDLVLDQNETYSADSFTRRAIEIMKNVDEPWFIYLAYTLPHFPIQVPERFKKFDRKDQDLPEKRITYLEMINALDNSIGEVVEALKSHGIWEDTIFIFTSDNGGEVAFGGNNWPLRGQKYGIFEGGTRSHAFLTGPQLESRDYDELFHVVDWFTTIQSAIGIDLPSVIGVDSVDHWASMIRERASPPRDGMIYNIRPGSAAIRTGNFKLILGDPDPLLHQYGWYSEHYIPLTDTDIRKFNLETHQTRNGTWLYNLRNDSNERSNLAETETEILRQMLEMLEYHMGNYKPTRIGHFPLIGSADPKYWGGAWSPGWCKSD